MEKTTMSVQELSAQMGISLPKAYELVKEPGFPTIRIGARILIPIEAYKEWYYKNKPITLIKTVCNDYSLS